MDDYQQLITQALKSVGEIFPWDLAVEIQQDSNLILLDIRESYEFDKMHIKNSLHVPRGLLEGACCWNYNDTVPILAQDRMQNIVLICRSGNRSILAVKTMQQLGFKNVRSLKLGIKGWNDNDMTMLDKNGKCVDIDQADEWLNAAVAKDKLDPNQ